MLGALGLISIEFFAMGISSGMRTMGSVAITGCLLSAIGYGVVDYLDN
jgi:hydroxyethylthiazole kinase-like sugar kinase family protein